MFEGSKLHPSCHHQLVFAKFDISIYYLPLYKRTVCYYKRANSDLIRRPIELFNWDKELRINHVDKQVVFFNETLMNILQKIVHNETIIYDDREPLSINETLLHINQFKTILDKLGFLVEKSKNNYYSKLPQKLSIKATSPKA